MAFVYEWTDSYKSVSYTHLVPHSYIAQSQSKYFKILKESSDANVATVSTVSYTHLDVYKRQVCVSSWMRAHAH